MTEILHKDFKSRLCYHGFLLNVFPYDWFTFLSLRVTRVNKNIFMNVNGYPDKFAWKRAEQISSSADQSNTVHFWLEIVLEFDLPSSGKDTWNW